MDPNRTCSPFVNARHEEAEGNEARGCIALEGRERKRGPRVIYSIRLIRREIATFAYGVIAETTMSEVRDTFVPC